MTKVFLYLVIVPLSIYALDAVRLDVLFKKRSSNMQIKLFYFLAALAFSYLIVGCIYDFSFNFSTLM